MKTELTAADCVRARACRTDLQFLLALLPRNFGIFSPPERGGRRQNSPTTARLSQENLSNLRVFCLSLSKRSFR